MKNNKKDSLKKQLQKGSLKKELPNTTEIEEITKKVYQKSTLNEGEKIESSQRTTLDMPKSLHIITKMEAMKDGVTLKEFILKLIRIELKNRGQL